MPGKVARETKLPDAREAYENHHYETKNHNTNLEAACQSIGETSEKKTRIATKGLSDEHDALKNEKPIDHALELGLLGGMGKTEYYEIASQTLPVQLAKDLGETEAAKLLQENLDSELAMDKSVTAIAKAVSADAKEATSK